MKKKVECFIIECDCCGEHFINGDGFTCYTNDPDGNSIQGEAEESGWIKIGKHHYCDKCHHIDDEDNIVTEDGHIFDGNTYEEIKQRI